MRNRRCQRLVYTVCIKASAEIVAAGIIMRPVIKLLFGSGERLVSLPHSQELGDHVLLS